MNPEPAGSSVNLLVSTVLDDGGVVYLNGSEAFRLGISGSPVLYSTYANRTVGDAGPEGPFTFDAGPLATGDNVLAAEVHQANSGSSDIVWAMSLDAIVSVRARDTNPPSIAQLFPDPGTTVASLTEIEVHFTEGVKGVTASDLLINGKPATNVTQYAPEAFVIDFAQPATGVVQVAWNPTQGITDLSANSNRFAGSGTYSYVLDTSQIPHSVRINEFMAGNNHGIRDEDGHYSDWLELYNGGAQTVGLGGWYLTDNPAKPTKWRIPNGISLPSKAYLVIWASGQDRTNPAAPLHTSFKLDKSSGNSLSLIFSDGTTILSSFPAYPQQYDDVSYGCDRLNPSLVGYFTNSTPGAANATLGPGFAPDVLFSVAGGSFQQPFTLNLSTTDTNSVIHYLLVTNGTSAVVTVVPTESSPVYTGPLNVNGTVQVRARAFSTQPGYFPGPLHNETYIMVGPSAASFSSDLPIVVFHNMGAGAVAYTDDQFMTMEVFDTKNGRSS
ncbi:MAG TPA: lamin tail domain-containing protein, partial [Verrucomicrobiae bacterium]|nr:lamin tail domain-containing protein [Verrucomicrobiae bacterium]